MHHQSRDRVEGPAVEILRCNACGAPVALGDGDSVACASCGAEVSIPAEQRALRDAVRADAATRTRAGELYAEVGTAPPIVLRVFAVVTPLTLLIIGLPIVLIVAIVLYDKAGGAIGRALFHVQIADVLSGKMNAFASYVLAFVIALGLLVLGAYARRRGVSLREVQAGLAVKPPAREGGPSTCRVCGAPLTIPTDAAGVMCDYCRADNLVRVPEAWIGGVKHETKKLAGAIEDAVAEHDAEVAALRKRLRGRMIGWAVIAAVVLGMFAVGFSMKAPLEDLEDWPPVWRADVAGDRTMHGHRSTVRGVETPIHPDHGVAPSCDGPWLGEHMGAWSTPAACDASGCSFRWIVALRHGEHVTVHTDALAGVALHVYEHRPNYGFDDDGFAPWRTLPLGEAPATFEGPLSAWYALGIRVDGMTPNHGRSLCVEIGPPT